MQIVQQEISWTCVVTNAGNSLACDNYTPIWAGACNAKMTLETNHSHMRRGSSSAFFVVDSFNLSYRIMASRDSSSSDEGHERVPFGNESTRRAANQRVTRRVFIHLPDRPRDSAPRGGEMGCFR